MSIKHRFTYFEMKSLCSAVIIFGMVVFCESDTSSSGENSSAEETTLTTAKEHPSASPKPSSLYRRINVQRVEGVSSTPLDLFRVRDPERRSHLDGVWKWDYWCQLQPKVGNCTSILRQQQKPEGPRQSYYYDAQLDTCLTFAYAGCDGNKNNFQSMVECERHCKGSTYMSFNISKRTTFCDLQPNAGLCMGLLHRYYYDINGDECKTFIYGGCGGNQNRFKTLSQCQEQCKGYE